MRPTSHIYAALTIAGSDSAGGAGIQADLRTFALAGVRGATVITCLTAQNRARVARIEPVAPKMIRAQFEAVFAETTPGAAKTGMLYSAEIVREVARFMRRRPGIPLVVDPVMISTSGRRLLQIDAVEVLKRELLPMAALVTPNRAEAEVLTGKKIETPEDMRAAARVIYRTFGCAALVKGGHVEGTREAIDILFDGRSEWTFSAPRARNVRLHGTGCTYSAAITAGLARGQSLAAAVAWGKQFVTDAIYAGVLSPVPRL
jgi:hydroxymethylpyrimidine/phosphomethylpyrimidine kinase